MNIKFPFSSASNRLRYCIFGSEECPGDRFIKKFIYEDGRADFVSICDLHISLASGIEVTEAEYLASAIIEQ
jgi:hypothetical protein